MTTTHKVAASATSGAIPSAADTPARRKGPARLLWSRAKALTTNAPITIEVTAATGLPIAKAIPATTASIRDSRVAGARPAPSSATPGSPMASASNARSWGSGSNIRAAAPSGTYRIPASSAPRLAARIATRRRPVGSGRQFGDHGLFGPIVHSLGGGRRNGEWYDRRLVWPHPADASVTR
jgi:hypothetical protein